jgi:hypothetical protein
MHTWSNSEALIRSLGRAYARHTNLLVMCSVHVLFLDDVGELSLALHDIKKCFSTAGRRDAHLIFGLETCNYYYNYYYHYYSLLLIDVSNYLFIPG